MAKARFLGLKYDMQDITTYHILSNALKISDQPKYSQLITDRIAGQIEVKQATTKLIYEKQFNDGEAKEILVKLCKEYPVVCSAVMKFLGEE